MRIRIPGVASDDYNLYSCYASSNDGDDKFKSCFDGGYSYDQNLASLECYYPPFSMMMMMMIVPVYTLWYHCSVTVVAEAQVML